VGSSGAAQNGSPLSGGYGGAKRMLWFMAQYANGVSKQKVSGSASRPSCRSRWSAAPASATRRQRLRRRHGIKRDEFLERFGAPMPPREFGEKVVSVLNDPKYADGFAFGLKGDSGITMLEGAAA